MNFRRSQYFVCLVAALTLASTSVVAFPTPILTSRLRSTVLHAVGKPLLSDRRSTLQWGGFLLASLLMNEKAVAADPKTILITGSNSGIGFEAAKILAEKGHTIIVACRTLQKSNDAVDRIRSTVASGGTLIPAECNLASLASIQRFVDALPTKTLDVLCLNAGVSLNIDDKQIQRTADGFELTG